jgi:DNA-binding NarL/FixJ family response regulator
MGQIRIALIDDHQVMREGLCELISGEPDMVVVGQAADGRAATELARQTQPDVVVLDITMPRLNGVAAIQRILDICDTHILICSMHTSQRMVLETIGIGARGYVTKHSSSKEIIAGIRAVMTDSVYLSSDIDTPELRVQLASCRSRRRSIQQLSVREKEVLQLIAEGKSTKEIAATLSLSVHTINRHRVRIMDKLNMRTVAELTKYAVREGLSPPT